jgi:NAD-dependent dihydropyrimidine dehydrogenase PreA subunit
MTYVIGEPCIGTKDQSCIAVCPVDCIYETEHMLVIHPGECIDCAACEAECPVEAIRSDADLTPDWAPFVAIGEAWPHGGRPAAETLIATQIHAGGAR